jgi:hypothetical protein
MIKTKGLVSLFALFSILCTIFVGVFSAADAWREHNEQSWPAATATLERCAINSYRPLRSSGRSLVWHIECPLSYSADADHVTTKIRSRSASSDADIDRMHQWVAQHPAGSLVGIHYDPVDHKHAVLTATDMPYAGPRTPDNLKLLLIAAVGCVISLTIARHLGPQSDRHPAVT